MSDIIYASGIIIGWYNNLKSTKVSFHNLYYRCICASEFFTNDKFIYKNVTGRLPRNTTMDDHHLMLQWKETKTVSEQHYWAAVYGNWTTNTDVYLWTKAFINVAVFNTSSHGELTVLFRPMQETHGIDNFSMESHPIYTSESLSCQKCFAIVSTLHIKLWRVETLTYPY